MAGTPDAGVSAGPKTLWIELALLAAVAAAVLLIAVLLPSAYGLLAGYQIQSLHEEGQRLTNQLSSLELEEAKLLSPARLEELARLQQFIDPAPQKLIYLDTRQGALAMNKKKF